MEGNGIPGIHDRARDAATVRAKFVCRLRPGLISKGLEAIRSGKGPTPFALPRIRGRSQAWTVVHGS